MIVKPREIKFFLNTLIYMKYIIKRFSKKEKESKTDSLRNAAILGGGSFIGSNVLAADLIKNTDKDLSVENKEALEKLLKEGKDRGLKGTEKIKHSLLSGYLPASDTIRHGENAGITSHELGHRHYFKEKDAGTIGKLAHKAYLVPNVMRQFHGVGAASFANGYLSGRHAAKLEKEGKEESKLHRLSGFVVPGAAAAATLTAEGLASKKGIQLLKKSGASKEVIDRAKKELPKAWGTYASQSGMEFGASELGRFIGRNSNPKKDKKKRK